MDAITRQDIEKLKADIAEMLSAQTDELREEVAAGERRLGVMIEDVQKQVSIVAEGVEGAGGRVDNHEKRIERIEDATGLPALEPVMKG